MVPSSFDLFARFCAPFARAPAGVDAGRPSGRGVLAGDVGVGPGGRAGGVGAGGPGGRGALVGDVGAGEPGGRGRSGSGIGGGGGGEPGSTKT